MTIPYVAKKEVALLVRQALAGGPHIEKVVRSDDHPHEVEVVYRRKKGTQPVRLRVKVSVIAA